MDNNNNYKIIKIFVISCSISFKFQICFRGRNDTVNRRSMKYLIKRKMASNEEVRRIWREADCVCFDVDSTVVTDEGIDELAKFLGKGNEVSNITVGAMQGALSYTDSLKARLDIIRPTRQQVSDFIRTRSPQLTPGIKELILKLQDRRKDIYLVSGGFRCIIEEIADKLSIPHDRIFANELLFFYNGNFAGFDRTQPTSDGNGKSKVIDHLKRKYGYKKVVHVGDGVTDMETCPPADAFIGFGVNQVREKVKIGCRWFVTDCRDLISALD